MKPKCSLMLLLVSLLFVTACGDSEAETGTTTALLPTSTSAAPGVTETATTQPASTAINATNAMDPPIQYGPAVLVAGMEDCDLEYPVHGTWTADSSGSTLMRDGWFECAVTSNDDRIAGTAHYTLNMDQWAMPDEIAAQAMWGTIRIENEGGAWEADYVGVYTDVLGDVFTALFTGSGDYAGLSYYQWAVETHGASWPTKGLIFPTISAMP